MAEMTKTKIDLSVPLTTVGKHPGGVYDPQRNTTVFHGKVTVDDDIAEDLLRRQKEHMTYERSLIRDNGTKDLDSGTLSGQQA